MGLFSRISRRVEIREKSRFQPALFYSRAIYRPVGSADMHDYYFSIWSTTGVGFHTVLGSPTLPVNEQVISFKMAKLQD